LWCHWFASAILTAWMIYVEDAATNSSTRTRMTDCAEITAEGVHMESWAIVNAPEAHHFSVRNVWHKLLMDHLSSSPRAGFGFDAAWTLSQPSGVALVAETPTG
jgi:hypothetical protein